MALKIVLWTNKIQLVTLTEMAYMKVLTTLFNDRIKWLLRAFISAKVFSDTNNIIEARRRILS